MTPFMDIRKAFVTINHEFLLRKLDRLGGRGRPLRKQCAKIENFYFKAEIINVMVPWGSILGPLLLIIHFSSGYVINFNTSYFLLMTPTFINLIWENFSSLVQSSRKGIWKWLFANRSIINTDKSFAIVLNNR